MKTNGFFVSTLTKAECPLAGEADSDAAFASRGGDGGLGGGLGGDGGTSLMYSCKGESGMMMKANSATTLR